MALVKQMEKFIQKLTNGNKRSRQTLSKDNTVNQGGVYHQ